MSIKGVFTFVLHSHLPYARLAGRWPHGEEWIHEATSETYLPLLDTLYTLKERGTPFKLTIGLTPVLCEQLADSMVLDHLDEFLDQKIALAKRDMALFQEQSQNRTPGDTTDTQHLYFLAGWYRNWYENVKRIFHDRFNRDIIGAFRQLQEDGLLEIVTSVATHAYLPLLSRDSTIIAQLKAGIASYERLFKRKPTGIWLPECAYRPAYVNDKGTLRPGIERFLAEQGITHFFSETHTIVGGQPVGVATGDAVGPYGAVKRRYVIPMSKQSPKRPATTFKPYFVSDSTIGADAKEHSGVVAIGRNNQTGQQVWSAEWGYPGDFDYREFHKKSGTSGLQYWRVTGAKVDLGHKDYYHPEWAECKVDQHAEHFAHITSDLLRDYHQQTGEIGLIASNYDTELFGHWWFEGVQWLGKVIQHFAQNPDIAMMTASEYLTAYPPKEVLHLPESSWGAGGTHFTWNNTETEWMWSPIHESEARMEALANRYTDPTAEETLVLAQTAREILLSQSSDWAFLVTTGQAREYAIQRFSQHIERFNKLAESLEKGTPDVKLAEELWELDKVFPEIDYRWFRTEAAK